MTRSGSIRQRRKKREEYIYATTRGPVDELSVLVDQQTGRIRFGNDVVNIYSERSYQRLKGPKVLSRIPQGNDRLSFDSTSALSENFDFVCAVDTNTRAINGERISVTAVATAKFGWLPEADGPRHHRRFDVPFCLQFDGLQSDKPENFGWMAALEQLTARQLVPPEAKIGLIVDSDLGNHRAFNERTLAVDNGQFLPLGVQLIYASSDAGKEDVANQILALADAAASHVFSMLETGRMPMNLKSANSPFFKRMRFVKVTAVEA